ncbi:hypothetical protein B0H21DRAFT_250081 [Amylocystis lapponica]|nr:hypothetical protein B0H21DRAFT_250081 [Amylocystis lapponica]
MRHHSPSPSLCAPPAQDSNIIWPPLFKHDYPQPSCSPGRHQFQVLNILKSPSRFSVPSLSGSGSGFFSAWSRSRSRCWFRLGVGFGISVGSVSVPRLEYHLATTLTNIKHNYIKHGLASTPRRPQHIQWVHPRPQCRYRHTLCCRSRTTS